MWENLEQRIRDMRTQTRAQESEIAALTSECARIEKDLAGFMVRYNRIVKPIADQVEAVKKALDALRDLQLQQMMGNGDSVDSLWQKYTQSRELPSLDEDDAFDSASKPNEDSGSKLKRLYRRLARRFHPDLATDDPDRDRRNRIMAQINNAYQEGDLELLESLDEATPNDETLVVDEFVPMAVVLLRRLQRQSEELAVRIFDLKKQRHDLRYGHIMELKLQESLAGRRPGDDFLKSIAADLQKQYWKHVQELDTLRKTME